MSQTTNSFLACFVSLRTHCTVYPPSPWELSHWLWQFCPCPLSFYIDPSLQGLEPAWSKWGAHTVVKNRGFAPAGWPSWLACHPDTEVVGVIPGCGSCPGFRFHPGRGASRRLEKSVYRWAFVWESWRSSARRVREGRPLVSVLPPTREEQGDLSHACSSLPGFCVPVASNQRRPRPPFPGRDAGLSPAPPA